MIEQRRYVRTVVDVPLMFSGSGVSTSAAKPARAKDISLGGMFIKTDRPPPLGSEVAIALTLPDQDDLLLIPGVVRWVSDTEGMGIQFTQLDNKLTHAITVYVSTRPTPRPGRLLR
jgi:uncharacterized protein (TIGR02266 family)